MHLFPAGTIVETNDEYFKTFGRKVIGTAIAMDPLPPNEITVVRWDVQEGNIIPEHEGNPVIMMTKDLKKHLPKTS